MTKSKNSSKFMVILTLALVVLLISLFFVTKMSENVDRDTAIKNMPSLDNQPVIGKSSAEVTIIEFGDYKCPSCKAYGEQVFPQLSKDFIDTGKARFSYINTPFHGEESKLGALAAESVFAQDKEAYWKFHKQLFDTQPRENHDAPWITTDVLLKLAAVYAPKVDVKKVEDDMKNQKTLPQVNIDEGLVQKYNIQQTPSIMIDGIMVKNPFDYNEITSLINKR
ncbi:MULTISPECIES: DsbA family protein [unclassified Paenibacillus]|uniref:DsbA family protein n=1 Tax=unclassified Paenibacillus TaxID=185978 RepID=UPI0036449FBA